MVAANYFMSDGTVTGKAFGQKMKVVVRDRESGRKSKSRHQAI